VPVESKLLPPLLDPSGELVPWPQAPQDSAATWSGAGDAALVPRTTSHDSL
jgi:hypothetical protein